jgi:DNA-binding LacI/PurR family transcriptional regulator
LKVLLCKGRFAGPISGADETLMAYATQLRTAGVDVKVAVLYPASPRDPYLIRLREAGVPVSCIARNSPLGRAMQLLKKSAAFTGRAASNAAESGRTRVDALHRAL